MSELSDYSVVRQYRGKVKALILDWSGTTADAYVIAPTMAFVEVFEREGICINLSLIHI